MFLGSSIFLRVNIMLFCLLQEVTTCTKDPTLQAMYYTYQEDEAQVVMRFCKDTFHGEGFAVFFEAPYVPSSNNDHTFGEDGKGSSGTACFGVPHILRKFFRGLLSARSPEGSAQARHLFFGHVESVVWPFSRVPSGRACGRLESDFILTGFSGRLRHGELPVPTRVFSDAVA